MRRRGVRQWVALAIVVTFACDYALPLPDGFMWERKPAGPAGTYALLAETRETTLTIDAHPLGEYCLRVLAYSAVTNPPSQTGDGSVVRIVSEPSNELCYRVPASGKIRIVR